MNNITNYAFFRRCWLLLVSCLLAGSVAQAQSGPVGNEWIVPGQRYFKVKVLKDGIYKLDYQYLTKAGITGVAPSQLQVWRRGREVAVYGGGNQATLDATTYVEFYGQRNDGRLDGELYKTPAEQAHQYYNFYTDTSAYFITWSSSRGGRRMQQPVAAPGTAHPHRIFNVLSLRTEVYYDISISRFNFLPWVEANEGYFSGDINLTADSLVRNVASTGPVPRVEVLVMGGTMFPHRTQVSVRTPAGTLRQLGIINFTGVRRAKQSFPILRSDIGPNGAVTIQVRPVDLNDPTDKIQIAYSRVIVPQVNRWYPNRNNFFQNDSLLAGPATYELDSIPATVAGFDVHDPFNVQRVPGTALSTGFQRRQYVFAGATSAATHNLLLADEARLAVPLLPAREVKFRTINPATPTFIIITHPKLMRPDAASGIVNAAKDYAIYRKSAAGGNYDTLMVTAPQLYDQFTYGDRSWLALRHFSRWMAAATPATTTPRYLLLLGKGLVPSERPAAANVGVTLGSVVYTSTTTRALGEVGLDLVPTNGRAESDNMLTADFANDDFVAKLHVGRLTATTPRQIKIYLDKVRTHDALGPESWRKNMLHLVGGEDAVESAGFKAVLDRIGDRVRRPFLGGRVVQTEVRTTTLVSSVDISPYLNPGLSMITYFGHGSNNTFKLDFGKPSTAPSYNNPGRYPVLFLNGCAGNFTGVSTLTVVEDYLFAENKGAIGSLGESGFGFPLPLEITADTLTKLLFNDKNWYGKPITVVHDEMVRRLQHQPLFRNDIGIEQMLCTTWQGDPTIALFSPPLPDFVASAATLSIKPSAGQGPVKAASSSFILNVGVSNPGKVTYDSLEIRVTRTLGAVSKTYPFTVRQAWRPDTTYALTIPNEFLGQGGSSTFKVELDYNKKIAESNENNNTAQIDFTFLTGGLSVLNPTEFAIASTATPRLTVQSNNPAETSRVYEFELDTDPNFASAPPLKKTTTVTAGVLAEWLPTLPTTVASRDSVVWFWRARFQTPAAGEDGNWVTSSFRVIPNSPSGWSQSHAAQFRRDALTGVEVTGPPTSWAFTPVRVPLVLRTVGGGAPRTAPQFAGLLGGGIYLQSAGVPTVSNCGVQSPNLLIAVYDAASLRPLVMPAAYQRCGQNGNYSYFFSTSATTSVDTLDNLNYSATRQQQLDAFLTAIPNNAYVAVISTNRLRYSLLPAALKNRLKTLLGSQLITSLADGEPLALVGQKLTAASGRLLHEKGPDRTLATLAYNQRIELADTLLRPGTSGRIVSTQIGPSQQWNNLYASIVKPNASSQYTLKVVGITATGTEATVLANVPVVATGNLINHSQPLAGIVSAATYPYLRLELTLSDTAHMAPQLRQWLVTSRGLPEGVVQRDAVPASTYAAATLLQQATSGKGIVSFPVKFKNVSTETFNGPLNTRVQVRDLSNNSIRFTAPLISSPAPLPGETATISASVDMKGLFGRFAIEVVVNPRLQNPGLQPEQNYANNELILPEFTIINNNVPPTLDVAVDGRHILNGELVSSMPVIVVQLNDEDPLVYVRDRNAFTLTLQRPGQSNPVLVPLTGADISFTVDSTSGSRARLTFEPGKNGPLPDGKYTLRVQGRDPNNAAAAAQEVQLMFEVVNAATITNVYPYPNPVISKARFVFTVTGQELPRNMKIQIMSLTGRVVREIFMSELGPLHIGNNITDYAWDGTDSYGDRLANGTYLYRVAYDDSNVSFSRRETAGDKAFKNDWGKLVLMR
ncbi:hypothetical protein GCM10022409_43550 [Hymenobacter glaciei]|uniref:Gingipain domain-containing protein n=1 Tax=Hymenobacter glaciei TaxID=877209 RepID=A0ABP7UT45_9BACT